MRNLTFFVGLSVVVSVGFDLEPGSHHHLRVYADDGPGRDGYPVSTDFVFSGDRVCGIEEDHPSADVWPSLLSWLQSVQSDQKIERSTTSDGMIAGELRLSSWYRTSYPHSCS